MMRPFCARTGRRSAVSAVASSGECQGRRGEGGRRHPIPGRPQLCPLPPNAIGWALPARRPPRLRLRLRQHRSSRCRSCGRGRHGGSAASRGYRAHDCDAGGFAVPLQVLMAVPSAV
eukprot:363378-Chlamydomonas_euryale.AAC.18